MKFRINLTQFYVNFIFPLRPFKGLMEPFLKGLKAQTTLYAKLTMLNSQWYSEKLIEIIV